MALNNMNSNQIEVVETIDGTTAQVAMEAPAGVNKKVNYVKSSPDKFIWGIYILFLIISVVELFSASSTEVSSDNVYKPLIRHVAFLAAGLGIVLWFQNLHYIVFKRLSKAFALLSFVLLILSTFMGVEINGAQRAINVAGMTIQPPEIVKLSVVVLLACILGVNQKPGGVTNKGIIISASVVLIFGGILWKSGLTNTILLMGISFSMFLIGGIPMKKLCMIILVYAAFGGALFVVKYLDKDNEFDKIESVETSAGRNQKDIGGRADTHKGRIARFLEGVDPNDPIDDFNRQVIFANFAQAHGGFLGQGPGNSRESARLPLAFSDYIFSIIIEDTGFLGGVALLFLYLCLIGCAGRIAMKCSRAIPAFLIMGCAVMIVFQALVHMAIVTGLFPVSGQPLPFISKGGTSILIMSAAIGIMLSVSRFAVTSGKKKDIDAETKSLPEDMQAANYSTFNK